jgi:hypothetical protein
MTASHWSAWVGYLHCGAFAADFAERVEEEEEGLEEGVEVQAVPESSPVDIQQQLSALSKLSPEWPKRNLNHFTTNCCNHPPIPVLRMDIWLMR